MGVLDWFRRKTALPAERKARTLDQILADFHANNPTNSGVVVNEESALRVATVVACVQLIANDVAALPLQVMNQLRTGQATRAPEYDMLLRSPNGLHTAFEFKQMMTAQAVLRGNAYAYKAIGRDGRVAALWPLAASEVSVNRDGRRLRYTVSAYDGDIVGDFGPDRIMHLRGLTWNGWAGVDRVWSARDAIGLSSAAEGTQGAAFKNGTRMPGYWATDGALSDEAYDRLAAELLAATTGRNAYKSPLLDGGVQFKTTGQTLEDAQLIETRKHQIIEICAHFGVAPAVLGIDDRTQAFASVQAMMRWHLQHTLRPWLTAWEQTLDRDVLDGGGPLFARFDTSSLTWRENYRDIVELGIVTRNEARRAEGLPELPGLDEPLTPLNMQQGNTDEN